MKKRKPASRTAARRRLRANPVQVYLSDHELGLLDELAERRGCTRAELVRRWIHREQAKTTRRSSPPPPLVFADDPRQLRVPGS